jgi:hypothetical protein
MLEGLAVIKFIDRILDYLFLSKRQRDEHRFLDHQMALMEAGREDEAIINGMHYQAKEQYS